MWVQNADWMLADDEPAKPSAGTLICAVGVRVWGVVVPADGSAPDGVVKVRDTVWAETQLVEYALTGVAAGGTSGRTPAASNGYEHAGAGFLLAVGADRFQVRFEGRACDVVPNSRVTVTGVLELVAEYAWDGFDLIDTRTDWLVTHVAALTAGGVIVELANPVGDQI